jgi:hypothetical protein
VSGPTAILSYLEQVQVYKFRSGRLIPGTMMPDGEFVPAARGAIIRFEEHKQRAATDFTLQV